MRLLRDRVTVGECQTNRTDDNILICGDALNALTSLTRLPEFKKKYAGKVRLVYIDPPFNTGKIFAQYDDAIEHSVWLTMLRDRLDQIKEILHDEGSVWLHLNDDEVHRARMVMDEVFDPKNFVATFIWKKADSPNDNKVVIAQDHDYIICYTKTPKAHLSWNRRLDPTLLERYNQRDHNDKPCYHRVLRKAGKNSLRTDRPTMWYPAIDPDGIEVYPKREDGQEGCWSIGEDAYKALVAKGEIIWKRSKGVLPWMPYMLEYPKSILTRPWMTIWNDLPTNRQAKYHQRELFPTGPLFDTPKPEELIARILEMATNQDDIVLDCFVGSGTTAAVAQKMGRRWITSERSEETIENYVLPRLTKVINGEDSGGITDNVAWTGGGGFRVLDVAPSMFVENDGQVFLADWATNEALGEATAAQLGYDFANNAPFYGSKGRTLLAVIDGVVTEGVVRLIVSALPKATKVTIAGTAIDPSARSVLRQICPGSTLRKIPASILGEYKLHSAEPIFGSYVAIQSLDTAMAGAT